MRIKLLIFTLLTISSTAFSLTDQAKDEENSLLCKLQSCTKKRLFHNRNEEGYSLPIKNLTNSQPDGYMVRLSFYRFGWGDLKIVLATSSGNHYEIGIQTSNDDDNEPHIFIRKLIDNKNMKVDFLLAKEKLKLKENFEEFPILKVLIEVTNVGRINMYINDEPKPSLTAFDVNVIDVEDVFFQASEDSVLSLYYNCPLDASDLPKQLPNSSLLADEHVDLSSASPDVLAANCKWYETFRSDKEAIEFIDINQIKDSRPDGYWLRLPLYMIYDSYAKILLTTDQNNWKHSPHLTIEVDAREHTIRVIDTNENVIRSVQFANSKQAKLEIRIPEDEPIEIFFGYFTSKPIMRLLEYDMDLYADYIGFASMNSMRAIFFYECSDRNAVLPQHQLLIDGIISSRKGINEVRENCTNISLKRVTYPEYIELSTIQRDLPNDFIVQIPFYAEGSGDVHILLSELARSKNNSYEIVIGAGNNGQMIIRKNSEVIGSTEGLNILKSGRPVKYVVEITRAGEIRLFTEYNTFKPILEVVDADVITTLQFISFNGRDRSTEFFINCK